MRKYISEGFVSILAQPCLLYIWDMLFLYEWDAQVHLTNYKISMAVRAMEE